MDDRTRAKWDGTAAFFDLMAHGAEKRWAPAKLELFARMGTGKILFLALGTGLDIRFFPPGREIVAVDISPAMVARARPRVAAYAGKMEGLVMDVHEMTFPDHHFDQVFTSCTFCSVPDPVRGLTALRRVLKPGGTLHMFEHTGSHVFPFQGMLNLMTPLMRPIGPEMNRPTVENVRSAGFQRLSVKNLYLDVVKTIEAVNP